VLGLLGVIGMIGPFTRLAARRRRRLLAQPWRRCPATVAAAEGNTAFDRMIVFEEGRSLVLRGTLPDVPSVLLHRQELFLVGPDANGRALIRVAGLCQMFAVKVDTGGRSMRWARNTAASTAVNTIRRRLRRGAYGWTQRVTARSGPRIVRACAARRG
jgi:hypothetical protein